MPAGCNDTNAMAGSLVTSAVKLLRMLRALDASPRLTDTEASALAVLVHAGPMNMGALARHEQVRPPSMTRTISNLEQRGLVGRTPDPDDARGWIVGATRQGRKLFGEGQARRIEPLRQWLDGLPERDLARLARVLPLVEAMAELRDATGRPASRSGIAGG